MKQLLTIFTISLLAASQLIAQTKPVMVAIAGGSFTMGKNSVEDDEKPAHTVIVSSFSMGKYEITVAEYKAFCTAAGRTMPDAPSWGWNDKHPMVNVNFNDANAYCNWLSETTGQNYRQPTEAEGYYTSLPPLAKGKICGKSKC